MCVAGCNGTPDREGGREALEHHARSVAPLIDVSGSAALGVAVRVSTSRVFFAVHRHAEGPSRSLVLGEQRLPAKPVGVPGAQLLAVERTADFRPCLTGRPRTGEHLVALSGGAGATAAWELRVPDELSPSGPIPVERPIWLPLTSEGEQVAPPQPDGRLQGAPVFTEAGAWAGFLEHDGEGWRVVPPAADALREAALESGQSDILVPGDPGRLLALRVTEVSVMPHVEDEWGDPDFFLLLRARGRALEPIPLNAVEHRTRLPLDAKDLEVELVERDVTLTAGDNMERVAGPIPLLPFGLSQDLILPTPDGEAVVFKCEARFVDPERDSGLDRTPLGARNLPVRRVVSETVSVADGDSSDLWRFEARAPAHHLAVVLRRESEATIDVSIHSPSMHETHLRGRLVEGRHLRILPTVSPLRAGPALLRVRQLSGQQTTHYSLVVVRRDDTLGLVRTLFRLVARAESEQPYLDTQDFAREVYEALALDAKLDREAVTLGVLAELGHRSRAGRRLALRLLEHSFRPDEEALRNVYMGADGSRSLDGGLLLALRHPNDSGYAKLVELAARDPDPLVRLLGLAVASNFTTVERRLSLRALFADDPSPKIQRVLARTR